MLLLLQLVSLLKVVRSDLSYCSSGQWIDNYQDTNHNMQEYHYLKMYKMNYTNDEILRSSSCPVELFIQNCRYNGINNRSNILLNRKWIPDDPTTCIPYNSSNFLQLLKNRKIYMLGDSIMNQIWTTLFCSIDLNEKRVIYNIHWFYYHHKDICLFPRTGDHCSYRLSSNVSYFLDSRTNSSFYFGWLSPILTSRTTHYIRSVIEFGNMNENDIIFINIGAHYNNKDKLQYKEHLEIIKADINNSNIRYNYKIPKIYFIESLPQHFDSVYYGYYSDTLKSKQCVRIKENRKSLDWDWRNILARNHFKNTNVTIISVASMLYDQYDAHVGTDSLLTKTNDCTHYCYESDVFRYIHTIIYNTVLNII